MYFGYQINLIFKDALLHFLCQVIYVIIKIGSQTQISKKIK